MRYSNGEILLVARDLAFKSFGLHWGHTRSYGNLVTNPGTGRNGNSWFVKEWPKLVPIDSDPEQPNQPPTLALIWVINETLWFDRNPETGAYKARFAVRPKLRYVPEAAEWQLFDSKGRLAKFYDFSASQPELLRGQFKSIAIRPGRNAPRCTMSSGGWSPSHSKRKEPTAATTTNTSRLG